MNGMKIDFVTNTVIITKAFREAANEYGSEEYIALTKLLQEHPSMKVVLRQSRTCHRANENKGLTYKYMRKFKKILEILRKPFFIMNSIMRKVQQCMSW